MNCDGLTTPFERLRVLYEAGPKDLGIDDYETTLKWHITSVGELGRAGRSTRSWFRRPVTRPPQPLLAADNMIIFLAANLRPFRFHFNPRLLSRFMAAKPPISRPAPYPLPPEQQREFELLQRQAETVANAPPGRVERHPDAPIPLTAEFDGDINPATGERGGPKREPVQRWIEEEGDWSFKGRVSDF